MFWKIGFFSAAAGLTEYNVRLRAFILTKEKECHHHAIGGSVKNTNKNTKQLEG